MRYKTRVHRHHNDFVFGTWRYESNEHGELIRYGILKKTKTLSKQMSIIRVS